MGQIFVSHSQKDRKIKNFFASIFGTTRVKGVFKEIEGFSIPDASIEIENDIRESESIFILLGPNVNKLHHTKRLDYLGKCDCSTYEERYLGI